MASVYLGFGSYDNFIQIIHVAAKDQYRHPKYTEVDVGYDIGMTYDIKDFSILYNKTSEFIQFQLQL